ncbi:MAG: LuxR C-terminal-related transcriptional regulator [Dehalococcoidia bacterium]
MTIRRSSGAFARETQLAALTTLTASVAAQMAGLIEQTHHPDVSQAAALAAIADGLASILDQLGEMQAHLTAQSDDLATTFSALESAHQRYRDLFELAPDAYVVTDAGSRILEANLAAIRLIGYSRAATYGRSLLSLVAADSALVVSSHLRDLDDTPADHVGEWEMRMRTRGRGPRRVVHARVRRAPVGIGSDRSFLWLLRRVSSEASPRPPATVAPAIRNGVMTRAGQRADLREPIRPLPDAADDTHAFRVEDAGDQPRPVAIVELIRQVIADRRIRAVQVITEGHIPAVEARVEAMGEALGLILDHVDRSAAPNAPLHVDVTATDEAVTVVVSPFTRVDHQSGREPRPISPVRVLDPARRVIDAHDGTLAYATNGQGCAITITLPVSAEHRRGYGWLQEPLEHGGGRRVSRREREVLGLLEQGLTNRQISERLVLSERTVEHHISRMLARFRLSTRTHLTAYALKHDLTGVSSIEGG